MGFREQDAARVEVFRSESREFDGTLGPYPDAHQPFLSVFEIDRAIRRDETFLQAFLAASFLADEAQHGLDVFAGSELTGLEIQALAIIQPAAAVVAERDLVVLSGCRVVNRIVVENAMRASERTDQEGDVGHELPSQGELPSLVAQGFGFSVIGYGDRLDGLPALLACGGLVRARDFRLACAHGSGIMSSNIGYVK